MCRDNCLLIARSSCREANQPFLSPLSLSSRRPSSGGGEPVSGRAFARPVGATRWLAMTVLKHTFKLAFDSRQRDLAVPRRRRGPVTAACHVRWRKRLGSGVSHEDSRRFRDDL